MQKKPIISTASEVLIFFTKLDWDKLEAGDDVEEFDCCCTAEFGEVMMNIGDLLTDEPYEFEDKWNIHVHELNGPNERPALDSRDEPKDLKIFESKDELLAYMAGKGWVCS